MARYPFFRGSYIFFVGKAVLRGAYPFFKALLRGTYAFFEGLVKGCLFW